MIGLDELHAALTKMYAEMPQKKTNFRVLKHRISKGYNISLESKISMLEKNSNYQVKIVIVNGNERN